MPALDSLYRSKARLWSPYYANREQVLGATATLVNFGDQENFGKVNAATGTGLRFSSTGLAPTWTHSEPLSAWDTPFDLTLESNWQGLAPILTFNGTDEEMDSPSAAYWYRDDSGSNPFSFFCWVNMTDATTSTIFARDDRTTGSTNRIFKFLLESTDKLFLYLIDDSEGALEARSDASTLSEGVWHHVGFTYDSAGGASASAGINLYTDGVVVDDTTNDSGTYTAMEDKSVAAQLGHHENTAGNPTDFFDGQMAGGPFCPFFTQVELTAAHVANLYQVERLGLHV